MWEEEFGKKSKGESRGGEVTAGSLHPKAREGALAPGTPRPCPVEPGGES